jgi:hypothetical protein
MEMHKKFNNLYRITGILEFEYIVTTIPTSGIATVSFLFFGIRYI